MNELEGGADFLERHLAISGRRLHGTSPPDVMRKYADFVDQFLTSAPSVVVIRLLDLPRSTPALAIRAATRVLRRDGFDILGADMVSNRVDARFRRIYDSETGWLASLPRRAAKSELGLDITIRVDANGSVILRSNHSLPSWEDHVEQRMRDLLEADPDAGRLLSDPADIVHDALLKPGRPLDRPFTGSLRDFSGCAKRDELGDLERGVLPMGRWTFVDDAGGIERGAPLFLSNWRTGAPMIYNGALICAPQNSGKTDLISRWAVAANRAGYNVLVVDVKGNMRAELAPRLRGRVFCFSTDPDEDSDCINFLAGLHGVTPKNSMQIRQLVAALMPRDGWEEGEQAYFYQNHFNWFSALIHITLLAWRYQPETFERGVPHLGHVFEVATDYQKLLDHLRDIGVKEVEERAAGREPAAPGIAYWRSEIALLLDPADGGERTRDFSYRTLTGTIVNALRPFSRFGTLHAKIGGPRPDRTYPDPERSFTLEALDGEDEATTIILAAREQDLDDANTVLGICIRKLQQFLFERMKRKNLRPALLLLDETRRIRGFKANEYITFARQAQAGCVIVYQSLDQIGDEAKIREILENIGVQIYLGALTGHSARCFIDTLPIRFRPVFSRTMSYADEGGLSIQTGQESVDYFTSAELHDLPAGEWPALVYLNGLPRRKPFLVDLSHEQGR